MKLVLKLVGILIIILAAVFIYLAFNLGQLVKDGIETYAPPIVGTTVTVGSVQLSPFSGSGSIKNFDVGQPAGYGEGNAISLGKIAVDLDPRSLTSDTIVIHRITLDAPTINLVQLQSGNNIQTLVDHIRQRTAAKPGQPESAESGPGKKVIIDDFTVSNASVSASSPLLKSGEPIVLKLADIHITGIGRKTNGERAGEVAQIIAKKLQEAVTQALANSKVFQQQIRDQLEGKAREKLEGELNKQLGKDKTDLIKGLLNR